MKIKILITLLIVSFLSISCFEDMDDKIKIPTNSSIQQFIYRGLNYYYLYKADTPELANNAFSNDSELENFLESFDSPEALFEYLKSPQDRFSRLFNDYNIIEDALSGISVSNGMEFGLVYYPDNSGNVFGYVRYVLPNTDADSKGVKRGDLFTKVDGVQLNENNYNSLLSPNNYTIEFADFDGNTFILNGISAQLNKTENEENPIYISRTLHINNQKIGYLMYNSFIRNKDSELNDAFAQFKADGVTDLVLDLRYNGGGAVETATDLASMITGQFNGEIFYKEFWNADRQEEMARNGLFDNTISNGSPINSLNLNNIYIITSSGTASASELVINGLDPYINTVQIGDTTTGKFQASFLLYDAPAPNFSKMQSSPAHTYVMLPLVFKTANKADKTDFIDGLFPNVVVKENFFNLGQLGNENEPLLATALSEITGSPKPAKKDFIKLKELYSSKSDSPINGKMIAY